LQKQSFFVGENKLNDSPGSSVTPLGLLTRFFDLREDEARKISREVTGDFLCGDLFFPAVAGSCIPFLDGKDSGVVG
jgi:hypothetical protein